MAFRWTTVEQTYWQVVLIESHPLTKISKPNLVLVLRISLLKALMRLLLKILFSGICVEEKVASTSHASDKYKKPVTCKPQAVKWYRQLNATEIEPTCLKSGARTKDLILGVRTQETELFTWDSGLGIPKVGLGTQDPGSKNIQVGPGTWNFLFY